MTTKVPNSTLEVFEPAACFRASHSVEQTATANATSSSASQEMRFDGFAS